MKKKILFSHFSVFKDGGWYRSFSLAKGLVKCGNDVTFLTTQNKFEKFPYSVENIEGVNVVKVFDIGPKKLKKLGVSPLSVIIKLFFVLKFKFDIVHADSGHRPSSGFPCRLNRLIYKSKYITEWWDFFGKGGQYDSKPLLWKLTYGFYDNYMEKKDKKIADGVVPLSIFLKRRALDLGVNDNRILVLNGGADNEKINFYQDNTKFRKKFNIKKDAIVFCFVGMNKGEIDDIENFIKAFVALNNKKFVLLTTGKKLSKNTINYYKLNDYIVELGFLNYGEEFSQALSCADYFISVLKNNKRNNGRWPNKIGDYLAAGRPVLISPVGDLLFYHKKYPRIFINVGNTKEENFNSLKKLLSVNENPDYNEIRKISENYFDWNIKARMLNTFYNKLLTNNT